MEKLKVNKISLVVPVYNSESTIENLVDVVIDTLSPSYEHVEIVLVNDGSPDNSHECAVRAYDKHPNNVRYVRLARNFSEHNAVMCGLNYVTGDCAAIIDDDFQNPPSEIIKMVDKLKEGYDVVFSYYDKKQHHWFRNLGSSFNDWFATRLLKKPKGLYLSSFKVIHKGLIKTIVEYNGPYPYVDGIILRSSNLLGTQLVDHVEREEGKSNYTLSKLISLWLNMFTGFSALPLRMVSMIGIFMSATTPILVIAYLLAYYYKVELVREVIPPGWFTIVLLVNFMFGLQLMALGIVGEYIGRLFMVANQAPQFVVRDTFIKENNDE